MAGSDMKSSWIKISIIVVAIAVGYGSYLVTRQPDGVVEQAAESILRTQGINIDLSPE
jgi:hypothetical protein